VGGGRFSALVQTCPGAHPASYTMGTGSFPGINRPGRGVDHTPSSAEVKERVELYFSPSGPSWPVLGRTLPLYLTLLHQLCEIRPVQYRRPRMMTNTERRTGYHSVGLGLVVASSTSEGHISVIFRTKQRDGVLVRHVGNRIQGLASCTSCGICTLGGSLGASHVYLTVATQLIASAFC
jgi:hypothetical protein